jgi:hypothetical protein
MTNTYCDRRTLGTQRLGDWVSSVSEAGVLYPEERLDTAEEGVVALEEEVEYRPK